LIAVIDYDIGNLRSVEKAVVRLGYECVVTRDLRALDKSAKLILPGVGNFGHGMDNLNKYGLTEALKELVTEKQKPILGICLGMQLMTEFSEEGNCKGLGLIKGQTRQFRLAGLRVPHIGWNTVDIDKTSSFVIDLNDDDEFYFVHSYYVSCDNSEDILFRSKYEITFTSGFLKGNIMGVQFHPEKSHLSGLKVLKSFLAM
jgi:glutamine amidotransferase